MSTIVKYPNGMAQEEFYTAEELAKKLKLNVMTIYRHIKAGRLKVQKIGKEFRIPKEEFENFINIREYEITVEQDGIRKILEDKDNKILRLEKDLERMRKSLRNEDYGLAWIDVPEAFEDDVENKLPIVIPVSKLDIKDDDGKPTHLLIEGENYHALTCLNYTHKGKIDVIYIDPPYNTGSDGFRYKDKRILDKYPDGTEVPKDHPLRHSYWLSFMRKRLELSKDLLSDTGAIFISIDDNEVSQLKLLCDQVFGESNFVDCISWEKKSSAKGVPPRNMIVNVHEYILIYQKTSRFAFIGEPRSVDGFSNPDNDPRGPWRNTNIKSTVKDKSKAFPITDPATGNTYTDTWAYSKDELERLTREKYLIFPKNKNGQVRRKEFFKEFKRENIPIKSSWGLFDNQKNTEMLKDLLAGVVFLNPKPLDLMTYLIESAAPKNAIVLDYFAGSGTTGHAILKLNKSGANRQVILCTNNEEYGSNGEKVKHKICSDVCYPRLSKTIKGYKTVEKEKIEGLGGSLKYYRIAFVGEHSVLNTNDKDKLLLAHNATELLAIAENTLEAVTKNDHFEIFENEGRYTAIYFKESFDKFDDFTKKVLSLKKPTTVYIFSWENNPLVDEFEDNQNVTVKTIPEPILEIYRRIHNL